MSEQAKICFNGSLILPVTPESFEVGAGIKIETVNIHALGDLRIAGYPTLDNITISGFFPARRYRFAITDDVQPYTLVAQFKAWAASRSVVRFLVTGTDVNLPVLVETIRYGERDGSGDVYYTLTLAEYRHASASAVLRRAVDRYPITPQYYTPQKGENLFIISEKMYGTTSRANEIAKANGIGNAYVVRTSGIRIP